MRLSFPDPLNSHDDHSTPSSPITDTAPLHSSFLSDYSFLQHPSRSKSPLHAVVQLDLDSANPRRYSDATTSTSGALSHEADSTLERLLATREHYQAGDIGRWLEATSSTKSLRSTFPRVSSREGSTSVLDGARAKGRVSLVFAGESGSLETNQAVADKIRQLPLGRAVRVDVVEGRKAAEGATLVVYYLSSEGELSEVDQVLLTLLAADGLIKILPVLLPPTPLDTPSSTPVGSTLLRSLDSVRLVTSVSTIVARRSAQQVEQDWIALGLPGVAVIRASAERAVWTLAELLHHEPALLLRALGSMLHSTSTLHKLEADKEPGTVREDKGKETSRRITSILFYGVTALAMIAAALLESTPSFLGSSISREAGMRTTTTTSSHSASFALATITPTPSELTLVPSSSSLAAVVEPLPTHVLPQKSIPTLVTSSQPLLVKLHPAPDLNAPAIRMGKASLAIFAQRHLLVEQARFGGIPQDSGHEGEEEKVTELRSMRFEGELNGGGRIKYHSQMLLQEIIHQFSLPPHLTSLFYPLFSGGNIDLHAWGVPTLQQAHRGALILQGILEEEWQGILLGVRRMKYRARGMWKSEVLPALEIVVEKSKREAQRSQFLIDHSLRVALDRGSRKVQQLKVHSRILQRQSVLWSQRTKESLNLQSQLLHFQALQGINQIKQHKNGRVGKAKRGRKAVIEKLCRWGRTSCDKFSESWIGSKG